MQPVEVVARIELHLVDVERSAGFFDDVTEVHETVERLEALRRSVTLAIETWRAREVALVEKAGGAAVVDSGREVAKVVPKVKIRYDHKRIGDYVCRRALADPETGEIVDDPRIAAHAAVELMKAVYVSPATEPKKSGLLHLGFETMQHAELSREQTGSELRVRAV